LLRRNPFIGIGDGSGQNLERTADNSYCKRDISRMGAKQSEGIPIHAQQYRKHAGGVPLQ
jgi:hypothetical protein